MGTTTNQIRVFEMGQNIPIDGNMDVDLFLTLLSHLFPNNNDGQQTGPCNSNAPKKKISLVCFGYPEHALANLPSLEHPHYDFSFIELESVKRSFRFDVDTLTFFSKPADAFIALCPIDKASRLLRYIRASTRTEALLVFFAHDSSDENIALRGGDTTLGPENPVVYITLPFAGSTRIKPVMPRLLDYFDYFPTPFTYPYSNNRFFDTIASYANPDSQAYDSKKAHSMVLEYFNTHVRYLDYSRYFAIHSVVPPQLFRDNPETKFIQLMRDPRDMLNSGSLYDINNGLVPADTDKEEHQFYYMDEGFKVEPGIKVPIEQMVDWLIECQTIENVYLLRFEDVRYEPQEAYKKLITWLEFDDVMLPMTDGLLKEFWHLGTFEAMSKGTHKEGQEGYTTGLFNYMRKGEAGDYKNHFSRKVNEELKRRIGTQLISLGYAEDMDW